MHRRIRSPESRKEHPADRTPLPPLNILIVDSFPYSLTSSTTCACSTSNERDLFLRGKGFRLVVKKSRCFPPRASNWFQGETGSPEEGQERIISLRGISPIVEDVIQHIALTYTTSATMTLVQPTPEMSLRIQKDLNEEPDKNDESLQHIKEWLEKQPHLPQIDDDPRLLTFLRGCKFSLEKTKRKLDMYYTMRTALPEFFSNRDPKLPEIQQVFKDLQIPPLPGLTPEGRRVVCMRANGVDLGSITEGFKVVLMIGDIRLKEEQVGVAGDVYILDATIATPSQFSKFTPLLVKKFLVCVQEAYPVKLKEIHVVNVSPLVDSIINFVKPFLKEKIRDRIHIHSEGLESLYKHVPREMLPEEYGGNAGPIQDINDQWRLKLESYRDWFLEQEEIKADETRRPEKTRSYDDLFGVDGSFRKLTID